MTNRAGRQVQIRTGARQAIIAAQLLDGDIYTVQLGKLNDGVQWRAGRRERFHSAEA